LKARIIPQRVPHGIESKKRGREWEAGWHFQQMRQGNDRGIDFAEARLDLGEDRFRSGFLKRIILVSSNRGARCLERPLLVSETA
jgi:hypothetical protein